MKSKTFKITLCAILSATSIIAFTLENLFPPLILPGARLGISNVFILISVVMLGAGYGYATLIIKIIVGSLFASNPSSMLYSLPAGLISLTAEILIIYYVKNTSIVCASVFGAVINSTIQNSIFCLVTNTLDYMIYLPYLALTSVISGLVVGFIVYLAIKYLPNKYFLHCFDSENELKKEG